MRRPLPSLLLGCALVALPQLALAEEPGAALLPPPRPADAPPPAARTNHLVAGAVTTAAWYGAGAGMSLLFPDAPGARELRIPIVGPWLALGETGCADDDRDCSSFIVVLRAILTTMDGIGQAGGLAVIGEGLLLRTESTPAPRSATLELRATPVDVGRDGVGFGIAGTF